MTAVEELQQLMARLKLAQDAISVGLNKIETRISPVEVSPRWRDPDEDSMALVHQVKEYARKTRASLIQMRKYQLRQQTFAEIEAIRAALPDVAARAAVELGVIGREFRDGRDA